MSKEQKDALFLLEVLVDKVVLSKSPCFADSQFKTCVLVTTPNVEPIEICDDDSGGSGVVGGPFTKHFNTGKSCLFSLKEPDINSAMNKFMLHVSVFKSLPCGCLPARIELGAADIDMTKEFVAARKKNLECPGASSFQALQDSFTLVGENNIETGKIVLFLRISCFGGLIVTKFTGAGPMTLGAQGAGSAVDHSCNPARTYQTPDDPCICGGGGAGRKSGAHAQATLGGTPSCKGGGSGTCPPAQDPYSVMPCAEPDDACYCTGPHPVVKSPLACRNTDAYCLHIPKGTTSSLLYQAPIEETILVEKKLWNNENSKSLRENYISDLLMQIERTDIDITDSKASSVTSIFDAFNNATYYFDSLQYESDSCNRSLKENNYYAQDLTVCVTLWDLIGFGKDSSTQASASVNKCIQVPKCITDAAPAKASPSMNSNCICQEVYVCKTEKGMGGSNTPALPSCMKPSAGSTCCTPDTKKSVNILTPCDPCAPPPCQNTTNMQANVSHIVIAQAECCPIHSATTKEQGQADVKISSMRNARRGVFELVIRRMNGSPLPKNELMLEWTPPPCTLPQLGGIPPCYPSTCYMPLGCNKPPSCRMISCRPPRCIRKRPCGKSPCGRSPCGPIPCGPPVPFPIPCRPRCSTCCRPSCCGNPCRFKRCRKPCPPARIRKSKCPKCRSCKSPPCSSCGPCPASSCSKPCGSCGSCGPCYRSCPVGYGKRRRSRSYPRIKAHPSRVSPCLNRSDCCPVPRCRSQPCSPPPCVQPPPCRPCAPCPPKPCKPSPCSKPSCCLPC